jgi:hypothetical protein
MENRKPFGLFKCIRFYNCFQVVVCSGFVAFGLFVGFSPKYFFKCESFSFLGDDEKLSVLVGSWLFLGLRVLEFLETIFFILRKKPNQASFLHIFHHIGSATMAWLFIAMHAGKTKKSVINFD